MSASKDSDSRKLLRRLKDVLAEAGDGQERLNRVVSLVASSMEAEVCSIYLHRDEQTLELCATHGLKPESVHVTRLRVGEGLVGRVARGRTPVNAADAPSTKGFRYMPETGEEVFSSFLGVPVQRLGERLGVLVVQSREAREYSEDEVYALEVVAMVLAEMAELGAFTGEGEALKPRHQQQVMFRGITGQEGATEGVVHLHNPRVVITNPVSDDPEGECRRLNAAVEKLRGTVDRMLSQVSGDRAQTEVIQAFRMFAYSRSWLRRMEEDINAGLTAEAAVEKEQTAARTRMDGADAYLRDRLADLDDLSNRLLRLLTGQGREGGPLPDNAVLVARNIGPGELLEYGRKLRGVVLEEGSVGSHAAVVARAWAVPLVLQARGITTEALSGDPILVDGDQGIVHLRPDDRVRGAFREKLAMAAEAQSRYATIRDTACVTQDGQRIELMMNAGLMADLPSLPTSGAEGVGLFRTELQFLTRNKVPKRGELADLYARVMGAAGDKPVVFRTLDIGSDKVLPYMKAEDEPNPAMGWRAIRVGLDKKGVMRMQLQALLRAADGRPLQIMFPFIAQVEEFLEARAHLLREIHREKSLGHRLPETLRVGAMLETPSMAFAPRRFFEEADFISIGGNDLKQFFFAADRENERVRRRYDTLNVSFLSLIEQIVGRCAETATPVSFCGEDAGRPVEALCFAAMGLRCLSMRPASIGPVKHILLRADLGAVRRIIDETREAGDQTVREAVMEYLRSR
ncbi:putative PEP-binding protein [Jannaschia rubra]|uniref:Phosphoenolpyruvate-protein phosphotransferase n=1 Tax=Jannaschia rubra TaxID=282197 RepID=A0A0M6XUA6_9RHOB|nr:putative PEP-binding protein [Jannaschia rubra]CTQ33524.1 Phosphoenolpyruvate-protein phosphotransferase [Jannaschia rubra]SFG03192.1 PTSINtr with GAF domain, PtsP [Jannaschia rubra]